MTVLGARKREWLMESLRVGCGTWACISSCGSHQLCKVELTRVLGHRWICQIHLLPSRREFSIRSRVSDPTTARHMSLWLRHEAYDQL
jgi:hypothetical protein